MIRQSFILTIFLQTVFLEQIFAQDNSNIVKGPFYNYSVTTPEGWIRDYPENLEVAFLPDEKSKKDGSNFAYIVSAKINTSKRENLETVIKFDQKDFKRRHKTAVYAKQNDIITTKDKTKAVVYNMTIQSENYYEVIAYLLVPSGVMTIVMHSKTESDLIKYLPKFDGLVKSCYWVSTRQDSWILPDK